MKLNNKGFAITGILYTVFILFLMILLSVLSGLNIKRQSLEKNMENIKEEIEETCESFEETIGTETYITKYSGKYTIKINDMDDYIYTTFLSAGSQIKIKDSKIKNADDREIEFIGTTPINVTNAKIIEICTTDAIE